MLALSTWTESIFPMPSDPKFAKLREEYVKGKKRARNIREQFLIASGFIREEV